MKSNYAAERVMEQEITADAGRAIRDDDPKNLLARRIEAQGNAIYAVSMLLKMADEKSLDRISYFGDVSSLYEPLGHLMGILSDEVIRSSNEVDRLP